MRQTVIAGAATNPFRKLPYDKKKISYKLSNIKEMHAFNGIIRYQHAVLHHHLSNYEFVDLCCYLTPRLLNSKMTEDVSRIKRNLCAPVLSDYVAVFYALFSGIAPTKETQKDRKKCKLCILWLVFSIFLWFSFVQRMGFWFAARRCKSVGHLLETI